MGERKCWATLIMGSANFWQSLTKGKGIRLKNARAGSTGGRRVSVTGAAAAAFIDVTLVEKDGQPSAAHSVILRAVRPYSEIFWMKPSSPPPHLSGIFQSLQPIYPAYSAVCICMISDKKTCGSLTLPNIVWCSLTWPAWSQLGHDPPPACAGCGDTFQAQDPFVNHMM